MSHDDNVVAQVEILVSLFIALLSGALCNWAAPQWWYQHGSENR